ncbi:uncharacterized protein L201_002825 [Kwoniella dendrophila CBS 6074]|uniref:DUF7918 domain-containing protein n=1 Tax=Kwoniella dendrophila CBS 6074 TaxID=1295534 RepID=A0AAX4JR89_9TREE
MLSHGIAAGLEAWIEAQDDGKRLDEYLLEVSPAEGEKSSHSKCFVETIDEPFSIILRKLPYYNDNYDLDVALWIDGNRVDFGGWLKQSGDNIRWDTIIQKEGGKCYDTTLKFSPLPTTDDLSKVTIDPETNEDIGTIAIIVRQGNYIEGAIGKKPIYEKITTGIVDEKAKRFTYTVAAGEKTEFFRIEEMVYRWKPKRGDDRPFHIFLFQYRPRIALIQMGIIDESPNSVNQKSTLFRLKGLISSPESNSGLSGKRGIEKVEPESEEDDVIYLESKTGGKKRKRQQSVKAIEGVDDFLMDVGADQP